jgi:ABC-type sugar transport system ATPase subunit
MKAGISVIYQDPSIVHTLTVAQNVMLGREPHKGLLADHTAERRQAAEYLKMFRMEQEVDEVIGDLPVSKHQMVEIVKAIGRKAKILIFDEPTASLSTTEIETLFSAIDSLKEQGLGIIYVSHLLDEIFRIADRATVLRDGKRIGTYSVAEITMRDLVGAMVDKTIAPIKRTERIETGKVCLRLSDISNQYVSDISLTINKGEIFGIAGILGAGRTELARAIAGADSVQGGEMYLEGMRLDLRRHTIRSAIQNGIYMVTEDRINLGCFHLMSVSDNTLMSDWRRAAKLRGVLSSAKMSAFIQEMIELFHVKPRDKNMLISNLSGGNQQKVILARAYACNPTVLILDEPGKGIDIAAKAEIYDLVHTLSREDKTILLISSEWSELTANCDRIAVMRKGRIKQIFRREEFDEQQIMLCAVEN